ncbi:MAG: sorbosone dehydrogenase family protein [Betaproteobacteria bacterium]|nr:MAG: sorbosone dehydrogenase family protein [Betaproteobacteria bacterium]
MKTFPASSLLRWMLCALAGLAALGARAEGLPLEKIRLPPGFHITLFAGDVPNARGMAWGDKGTLFVGSRREGKVYAIKHRGGKATQVRVIATNLNMPSGLAFSNGALYVGAVDRILRYDDIEARLASAPAGALRPVVVSDKFPDQTHHGWKYLRFSPDGWLYVPVGAPCNVCLPDERHGLIARIRPDGSGYEVFARGVRNSVGFDFDPVTRELWFTDNGRDSMGDDLPSDELNHAPRAGMHFGFPYCHQGDTPDPDHGTRPCSEFTPPVAMLGPHVASLGMRFYTGTQFPAEYRNNIFIAEHGSWDRSKKIGYRVKRAIVAGGNLVRQEVFAEGWLQGESAWGRPADIEVMADGSLLVADDHAGAIYRISYGSRK